MDEKMKVKKNIEYANISFNPISGCCIKDCAVKERKGKCWAELMAIRQVAQGNYKVRNTDKPFEPTWHGDKIVKKTKSSPGYPLIEEPFHWKTVRWVDCCFMGDISCANPEWIQKVLNVVKKVPQHRFYFLTKNPKGLKGIEFPDNAWVGTTVNRQADLYRLEDIKLIKAKIKYVSFEPIYEKIVLNDEHLQDTSWIILGAQTNPEFQPEKSWVEALVSKANDFNIPIFMKDNLKFEPRMESFPK